MDIGLTTFGFKTVMFLSMSVSRLYNRGIFRNSSQNYAGFARQGFEIGDTGSSLAFHIAV